MDSFEMSTADMMLVVVTQKGEQINHSQEMEGNLSTCRVAKRKASTPKLFERKKGGEKNGGEEKLGIITYRESPKKTITGKFHYLSTINTSRTSSLLDKIA